MFHSAEDYTSVPLKLNSTGFFPQNELGDTMGFSVMHHPHFFPYQGQSPTSNLNQMPPPENQVDVADPCLIFVPIKAVDMVAECKLRSLIVS